MGMNADIEQFRADSFVTAVGTVAGYLAILLAMFVLLFVVPYVVFTVL